MGGYVGQLGRYMNTAVCTINRTGFLLADIRHSRKSYKEQYYIEYLAVIATTRHSVGSVHRPAGT